MTANSKIEWCDHTFNPWIGCEAISPGCDHCYAEAYAKRVGRDFGQRTRTSEAYWRQPLKWQRDAEKFAGEHGRRQRVFCASLADVFDNKVAPSWRLELFHLIEQTPDLDWLLLTKRIGNVLNMGGMHGLRADVLRDRVWLGATIVSQAEADRDIPKLFRVPARRRFLSCEPLLGEVDISAWLFGGEPPCSDCPRDLDCDCGWKGRAELGRADALHWVIAGGESGHGARPMHHAWVATLRDQCVAASVPFLFKQWGEHRPARGDETPTVWVSRDWPAPTGTGCTLSQYGMVKPGKEKAGRHLDGREWNEFPREATA